MSLQELESAIFDGHLPDWPTIGSNPQRKLLGRFLVLVGAASNIQVPVTSHGARRLHDVAVRGRSPRVPRWTVALKSSAGMERRQWRADEVFGQWNHGDDAKAEKCLEEWLQVLYPDMTDAKEMRRQALCDALPVAIQDIKAKLVEGKQKEVLLKSLHWLILQSDYLVLKDRFGLCLPVLLQILDSSTDSSLRFLGWDVLNLLLDRAIATEVQNFSVCLADFFQTHSPYPQEDICGLSVVPFSQSFAQFLMKAFADGKNDACVSREKQLEFFFTFGFFHCKSAKSEPFTLFLEFGLLPLLETSMLAPNLQELSQQLLQSCEGPQILEVLLSWRAIVLLFNQLPQRLGRYFQDILLRVIFSYLTFLISDPPEGLEDVLVSNVTDSDLVGFRSPVAACMTQAEWEEAISRRAELEAQLAEVLKMLVQHQAKLFNQTLMQLQSGSSFPAKNLAVEALSPQLQRFLRFAREVLPMDCFLVASQSESPRTWVSGLAQRVQDLGGEHFVRCAQMAYGHQVKQLLADPKYADEDGDYFEAWLRECHPKIYEDIDVSDPAELLKNTVPSETTPKRKHKLGDIRIPNVQEAFEELMHFDPNERGSSRRERVMAKILVDVYMLCIVDVALALVTAEAILRSQNGRAVVVVYAGADHIRKQVKFWESQGFSSKQLPEDGIVGQEDYEEFEPHLLEMPEALRDFSQLFPVP